MTDRTDFEQYADRGTPIGATVLMQRVEATLEGAGELRPVRPPRRQWSGPVLAAAAALAILLLGALWTLLRPADDVIQPAEDLGIEWVEVDPAVFGGSPVGDLVAGPGGFVVANWFVGPDGPTGAVRFSSDGRQWVDATVPGLGIDGVQVAASGTLWLARSFAARGDEFWVSTDGVTWRGAEVPGRSEDSLREVVVGEDMALAITADFFEGESAVWTLGPEATWEQVADPAIAANLVDRIVDGASLRAIGEWFVLTEVAQGNELTMIRSRDGVGWEEAAIGLPEDLGDVVPFWNLSAIERVGETWIAIAELSMRARSPVLQVWTSSDGLTWVPGGRPDLGVPAGDAPAVSQAAVLSGQYLAVAPARVPVVQGEDGFIRAQGEVVSTGEIWVTEDGTSWVRGLAAGRPIDSLAGGLVDGAPTVLWASGRTGDGVPAGDGPVVTTIAPVPDSQDVDQAGLDFQAEALADGVVTLAELTAALEGWQRCMEDLGVALAEFEMGPQGLLSREYGGPDPESGEAENIVCEASWIRQVESGPFGPEPEGE